MWFKTKLIIFSSIFLLIALGYYFDNSGLVGKNADHVMPTMLMVMIGGLIVLAIIHYRHLHNLELNLRQQFETIFKTKVMGFMAVDREGWLQNGNRKALKYFGLESTNVRKLHLSDVLTPEAARKIQADFIDKEAFGEIYEVEGRRSDGELFDVEVSLGEIPLSPGGDFTLIVRDISRRKRLENQLHQQILHLKDAEGIAGLGHWRMDVPTGKIEWSDECYRIHGYDRSEYTPSYERLEEFVHPDEVDDFKSSVEEMIHTGQPSVKKVRIFRPTGELRHLQVKSTVKPDETGRVIEMFGVIQDVTERVEQEESLHRNQVELERRVLELEDLHVRLEQQAAELVHMSEDLAISKEEAEHATMAKSEFLATMSHEI